MFFFYLQKQHYLYIYSQGFFLLIDTILCLTPLLCSDILKANDSFKSCLPVKIFNLKVDAYFTERERRGGVSAVSGHMTRKMWDLIPALDCSQLLKLCPSQCKLLICPITTSGAWVDSARRTMSGKSRRCSERPLPDTETRPLRNGPNGAARIILENISRI